MLCQNYDDSEHDEFFKKKLNVPDKIELHFNLKMRDLIFKNINNQCYGFDKTQHKIDAVEFKLLLNIYEVFEIINLIDIMIVKKNYLEFNINRKIINYLNKYITILGLSIFVKMNYNKVFPYFKHNQIQQIKFLSTYNDIFANDLGDKFIENYQKRINEIISDLEESQIFNNNQIYYEFPEFYMFKEHLEILNSDNPIDSLSYTFALNTMIFEYKSTSIWMNQSIKLSKDSKILIQQDLHNKYLNFLRYKMNHNGLYKKIRKMERMYTFVIKKWLFELFENHVNIEEN